MLNFLFLIVYILCSSFGMILIRKGGLQSSFSISDGKINLAVNGQFLLGIVMYVISFVVWIYILQLFPLTYISPIAYGIVYILIAILSAVYLHEVIGLKMIIASCMIIGGVLLASINL